jgi:hypothetical protein
MSRVGTDGIIGIKREDSSLELLCICDTRQTIYSECSITISSQIRQQIRSSSRSKLGSMRYSSIDPACGRLLHWSCLVSRGSWLQFDSV